MKKYFVFTLIVVSLLLSGCGGSPLVNQEVEVKVVQAPACVDCATPGGMVLHHTTPEAPPTAGPTEAPTEEAEPPVSEEVTCQHINGGEVYSLEPGFSANGGHVYVGDTEYLFVDDRVLVIRNNTNHSVELNSTDGFGVCNSIDFRTQVIVRFAEGCDENGCSEVKDVNLTNAGPVVTVYAEETYCAEHPNEIYCK